MNSSRSENSEDENESNICIMQFNPQQMAMQITSDRTDLTTNGPSSSTNCSSRYQSPFNEVGFIENLNAQIMKEIRNILIGNLRYENDGNDPSYVCKYVFDGAKLDQLLIGKDVLKISTEYEVMYTETCLNGSSILQDDIFIRSGHFARLVKKHISDNNPTLLKRKFGETNTYSKTLKLGFKLVFRDLNKRSIHYISLIEALNVIGRELGIKSELSESGDNESTSSINSENYEEASIGDSSSNSRSNSGNICSLEEMSSATSSIGCSQTTSATTSSNNLSHQNPGGNIKKRKVSKPNEQFIHLSTQTSSNQSLQSSWGHTSSSSSSIVPMLNIGQRENHSMMYSSQLNINDNNSFNTATLTSGIHNLEYEADIIEGEICDILDKLDLLKSQDLLNE